MRVRFKADMSEQAAGFAAKYSIGLSSARSFGVEAMQIGDLASALVQPVGLACLGRKLYFTESGMSRLRFVDLDTGFVSTLVHSAYGPGARDGPINSTSAYVSLREPIGLAGSSKGVLYIADSSNRMIRELKLAQSQLLSGNITWMSSMSTSPMGYRSLDIGIAPPARSYPAVAGAEANSLRSSEATAASGDQITSEVDPGFRHLHWIVGGICGLVAVTAALALVAVYSNRAKQLAVCTKNMRSSRVHTIDVATSTVPKPLYRKMGSVLPILSDIE
jgi:hypothetical protein